MRFKPYIVSVSISDLVFDYLYGRQMLVFIEHNNPAEFVTRLKITNIIISVCLYNYGLGVLTCGVFSAYRI